MILSLFLALIFHDTLALWVNVSLSGFSVRMGGGGGEQCDRRKSLLLFQRQTDLEIKLSF